MRFHYFIKAAGTALALSYFSRLGNVMAAAPQNDACANAIPLNVIGSSKGTVVVTSSNTQAVATDDVVSAGISTCGYTSSAQPVYGIWYKIQGPYPKGKFVFQTKGSSGDTVLYVVRGSCGGPWTCSGFNDNYGTNTWSRVEFTLSTGLAASSAMYILAGGTHGIRLSSIKLSVTYVPTSFCTPLSYSTLPKYQISLMNANAGKSSCSTAYDLDFAYALSRWMNATQGERTDYNTAATYGISNWLPGTVSLTIGSSTQSYDLGTYTGKIDDIVVSFNIAYLDGAGDSTGNILGAGGFYYYDGSRPISGFLLLDSYDVASLKSDGRLRSVLTHELGHILGLGPMWNQANCSTCTESALSSVYKCSKAQLKYVAAGFTTPSTLPIETSVGSAGSDCSHWAEYTLKNELMTPYIGAVGVPNPLSAITIGSLEDLGYTSINYASADAFTKATAMLVGTANASDGARGGATTVLPYYVAGATNAFGIGTDDACEMFNLCPKELAPARRALRGV